MSRQQAPACLLARACGDPMLSLRGGASKDKKGSKGKEVLPSPAEKVEVPAWRIAIANLGAGATAGAVVEAALYPIDTIKTRLQAAREGGGVRALFQRGGGGALYKGIWGNLVGVAPASAIFFGVYEPSKNYFSKNLPTDWQFIGPFLAGAVGGLTSSIVRVPTEVIKQRMQTRQFASPMLAVGNVLKTQGMPGMFAGYWAFLLRDLPFDAIEFFFYESFKTNYQRVVKREVNTQETLFAGAVAGAGTGLVTTPLDVLKTKLMTQGTSGQYKNLVDCVIKVYQQEGPAAFLKGWQARVLWISIGGMVFFGALEQAKKAYAPKGVKI